MSQYECLYGSSILPPHIDVNGTQIALGDLVRASFKESKLSLKDWNYLDEETRDAKLQRTLNKLRAIKLAHPLS